MPPRVQSYQSSKIMTCSVLSNTSQGLSQRLKLSQFNAVVSFFRTQIKWCNSNESRLLSGCIFYLDFYHLDTARHHIINGPASFIYPASSFSSVVSWDNREAFSKSGQLLLDRDANKSMALVRYYSYCWTAALVVRLLPPHY